MDNKRISEIVEEEMIKQDANRYRDMRKILTIPKSIADLADKEFNELNDDVLGFVYSFIECGCESSELRLWVTNDDTWDIESGKRANILSAYLAGKALGVDLVKVVE
ncbi:hypothetical protein [Lactococcus taiwanensis]|uniref:hypothetical protein n=1 Tax=Lactococcus taiwanensis TaxID=1151742 RepID=UPI0035143CFA